MDNRFAVIGLGRFGKTVATTLSKRGAEVLAIDINPDLVDEIRDEVAYAVSLDGKDSKALLSQNINTINTVIVAIGSDFESMLLTTVTLMNIGVKNIYARAMNKTQKSILEKIGIKNIILPEVQVGVSLAENLLHPDIITFFKLPDEYEIVEIKAPKNIFNRTIQDVDLRKKYNLNLITIKRVTNVTIEDENEVKDEHIIGVPTADTKILDGDILIVMGIAKNIKRFMEVNS